MEDSERQPVYVFEGFILDPQRRTLSGPDGQFLPIAPKTFDTLCQLVVRAGQLVGKRDLLAAVWPHVVVEENNLNQAISQLRRVLGERPDDHRFIVTEPGRGYRFVARVSAYTDVAGAVLAERSGDPMSGAASSPHGSRRRTVGVLAVGAALAAAMLGVVWYLITRDTPLPNSVAVLPFQNLSSDPDNAFFAAGLHGEIISRLAKISALNVVGQSSMLWISESTQSPQEIADRLNVETVLQATVEYADGRVRIRPQLVAAKTGQTLWAESYDRAREDIFAIEAEIAARIASALEGEFSLEEQLGVDAPPTTSPDAYAAYLRARALRGTSASLVLEYLDEATALDPGFALAYAAKAEELADLLIARVGQEAAEISELDDLERRIRAAAAEALRLDQNAWLARVALGNLHEHRWRWTQALREFELAAPNMPRGMRRKPDFEPFFRDLDFSENIAEQREIVALDPLAAQEHWVLGLFHAYERDAAAAAVEFRTAVNLNPNNPVHHVWMAHAESILGHRDAALNALRRAEQLPVTFNSSISIANLAYAYARNDRPDDARRLVELLATKTIDRRQQAGNWALAYFAVGDVEGARRALESVVEKIDRQEPDAGYLTLRLIKANIYSDPVLDEPAFVALRERLRGR